MINSHELTRKMTDIFIDLLLNEILHQAASGIVTISETTLLANGKWIKKYESELNISISSQIIYLLIEEENKGTIEPIPTIETLQRALSLSTFGSKVEFLRCFFDF